MERRATRAEIDQIAWKTIKTAAVCSTEPFGYSKCGRPSNYAEFGRMLTDLDGDFGLAWGEFLHEFYRYRTAGFFAEPPPENLSPGRRAMLAGTAEYLSKEFNLPIPPWTERPEYFLPEIWDSWSEIGLDVKEFEEERKAKSHECFLRRNVIYASRDLITL
jgi:hypothetical protein